MSDHASTPNLKAGILTRGSGPSIAYRRTPGRSPGVIFMTGFMSDMSGGKALALEELCRGRGNACLRFDYAGHGESEGAFADGTIGSWAADALAALDELTDGPQVLVGSSMGGWIMLLAALARPKRIAGLVGIAPAPDFTERLYAEELTREQRDVMKAEGKVIVPSDYEDDYTFTQALIDDGKDQLLLGGEIAIDCPVRLIHGLEDDAARQEVVRLGFKPE